MNIMGNLKLKVGEYVLKKHTKHVNRKIRSCNLKEAKKIGVLFNATNLVSFEIVKDFIKQLSTPANEILVLGFVDSKQLIDHYLYRKGFEFFTKAHLNWYNKPQNEAVKDFLNKDFDLLIDLSLEENYPIKYLATSAKSLFKAGRYDKEHFYLDFMIDINSEIASIKELQIEIDKDREKSNGQRHRTNFDSIAEKKTDIELQLNFLINQLVHYLSLLKN